MAKKKGKIKQVVETVEGWVGIGPKATKKKSAKSAKTASPKKGTKPVTAKGKKAVKKKK